ncbi:hypothetical protein KAS79_03130 [Candidatus Parcubacteria bacterium]|nr:hypothetical protein [Candidatus Parcubacteria bacterium]
MKKNETIYWISVGCVCFFGILGILIIDNEQEKATFYLVVFGVSVLVMFLIQKRYPGINKVNEKKEERVI